MDYETLNIFLLGSIAVLLFAILFRLGEISRKL